MTRTRHDDEQPLQGVARQALAWVQQVLGPAAAPEGDPVAQALAFLAAVLEHLPVGVLIASAPSGRILLQNSAVARFWRQPLPPTATIDAYAQYQGFHPDGRPYTPDEWPLARAILRGEDVSDEEIAMVRGDGTRGVLLVRAAPIRDVSGTRVAGVATFTDITERKRLEEERAAQRQLIEEIFQQAPALIAATMGPDHVVQYVNPVAERVAGHRAHALLGRPLRAVFPEVEGQGIFELFDRVYQTGEPFEGTEVRVRYDRDGDGALEEAYFNVAYVPLRDERGAITGIVQHAVEVTAQVRARQQVQAERDRLQQVLDVLPVGLLIADTTPAIVMSNRAIEELFGVPLLGRAVPVARPDTFAPCRLDGTPWPIAELPLVRALRGERVQSEQVVFRHARYGHPVTVLVHAAPLQDGASITGAVAAFQDISALRALEQQREEFLSSAAHDLKTPLTIIHGYAGMAREHLAQLADPAATSIEHYLEQILSATTHQLTLIEELLDVTHLQMGVALTLQRSPTDLVALARRVAARQEAGGGAGRIRVKAATSQLVATVDGSRIERVLGNLLSNALKYSPPGSPISVRVALEEGASGPAALIAVQDRGVGIPAADLPYIFERFRRAANVVGHIRGTGIGLASARQIVEQHGGTITVESQEGVGSRFTVHLPLRSGAQPTPGQDKPVG